MIGFERLSNLQVLIRDLLARNVPGDLLEAGVWRGGATVFMRGILKAHRAEGRVVWVADSFRGFPPPRDVSEKSYTSAEFAIPTSERKSILGEMIQLQRGASLEAVRATFERYGLLDSCVRFLPGWFRETLPAAPIERLALLRIDCDLYDSTLEVLQSLYPRVSPGGYIIVDDYNTFAECRQAVHDYLKPSFDGTITPIDADAVFWCKV